MVALCRGGEDRRIQGGFFGFGQTLLLAAKYHSPILATISTTNSRSAPVHCTCLHVASSPGARPPSIVPS